MKRSRTGTKIVRITGTVRSNREESKAIGLDTGEAVLHWIPKSQIHGQKLNSDGTTTLSIPKWLADSEGIESEEDEEVKELDFE